MSEMDITTLLLLNVRSTCFPMGVLQMKPVLTIAIHGCPAYVQVIAV